MNRSCIHEVNTCLPCNDSPVENLSAEALDLPTILGIATAPRDPPLGDEWSKLGCLEWCFSNISQADADACAEAQADECIEVVPDEPTIVDYPWVPNENVCSDFDCCGSGTPYAPAYALRPKVVVGATTYWMRYPGPDAFSSYVIKESVDTLNGMYNEQLAPRFYCWWTDQAGGQLVRLGSRWELFLLINQIATTAPSTPICTADTGPPSFDCTAIGCSLSLAIDYVEQFIVYISGGGVAWQDDSYEWFQSVAEGCWTSLVQNCIGACELEEVGDCIERVLGTAPNQVTIRDCTGFRLVPDSDYNIACNLDLQHWTTGAGSFLWFRNYYRGIRLSTLDSGNPRGTYTPVGGDLLNYCGHRKAAFTPLPEAATVTLEVPPP